MKDTFTINDLSLITGLTTRTLRNYITTGFLTGEKQDGAWVFTAEQVESFIQDKAVQPSIHAKRNAIVFDFLGTKPNQQDRMCAVLDLPLREAMSASVFFCQKISGATPESELRFASEPVGAGVRLILSGSPGDVLSLLNQFYARA